MEKKVFYVYNSYIEIPEYKLGTCTKLEYMLSYFDDKIYKRINTALFYNEETETLRIPRGIHLEYIEFLLNRTAVIKYDDYNEYDFAKINLKVMPRDEDQQIAISYLIGENEFTYTKQHSQLFLTLNTAVGKTYCAIASAAHMRQKVAIIVDETDFIHQWIEKIMQYSDIKEHEIYTIKGSDTINKLMKMKDVRYKVFLVSNSTLGSYMKKNGNESLNKVFQKMRVGLKVIEEAHSCFSLNNRIDCFSNVRKTIYLTATAGRSNFKEDKIFKFVYQDVPKFGKELFTDDDKFINAIMMTYDSKPSMKDVIKCRTNRGFDVKSYVDYSFSKYDESDDFISDSDNTLLAIKKFCDIINHKPKANMLSIIKYIVHMYLNQDGKIAIMLPKNDQILFLKGFLLKHFENRIVEDDIGIFSGLTDSKNKMNETKKKIILTTDKSFGKGKDIEDLKLLINTTTNSSEIENGQKSGRLRKNKKFEVVYIGLFDFGFHAVQNHFLKTKKVLELKCKTIKKINI